MRPHRRQVMLGAGALVVAGPTRALATPETMRAALEAFTGGATVRAGRVTLDIPPLVDNGNSAPLTVTVDSPMSEADHVTVLRVFNEKNPQPEVVTCLMGPRCGRAAVSTRIKLADTQTLHAVARMSDGTFWGASADVIVTIAACIEQPT